MMRAALAVLVLAAAAIAHPLSPLSAGEIQQAAGMLRADPKFPRGARFSFLALDEPPKEAVLHNRPVPRRAFAVIYDRAANRTYEAVANLSAGRVESWNVVPGVQPAVSEQDSALADRIVRSDPRWGKALAERGIRDENGVLTVAWPAGWFGFAGEAHARMVRVTPYYNPNGANFFGHPIEGVAAHVDLTHGRVIEFLDTDRNAPVPWENSGLTPAATAPQRPEPAPLLIRQPAGPDFKIADGEVRWQKWRFRYGFNPREGLVLYTVGYEDEKRVRPIVYRAALSEMVVPYGDPGGAWFFRNSFDVGELGVGLTASPLRPGVDCPQNCKVYGAVVADGGVPRTIPGAVAIYERDGGIAWKDGANARRARDLVVSWLTEAGNYEYGFDWIFHEDGALEMQVTLTGIVSAKAVPDGKADPYGDMMAKNLEGVHHQHFFAFRLDMDVEGPANRVIEMNDVPMPEGAKNPYGGGFTMEATPLRTEREAERRLDPQTSRKWIVVNPAVKNALGQPVGYALMPGENAVPMAHADSWVRKRAGFLNAHVWVTPYDPGEMYAAGNYPNQSKGSEGLATWTAANRRIDDRDVVLWYVLGITHNPRPEDWPVMPVQRLGFMLAPWGFFGKNPALDLPVK